MCFVENFVMVHVFPFMTRAMQNLSDFLIWNISSMVRESGGSGEHQSVAGFARLWVFCPRFKK